MTVVGSVDVDAVTQLPVVRPHPAVGLAILLHPGDKPSRVPLEEAARQLSFTADYRLMWSLILCTVSAYLIYSGLKPRSPPRSRSSRGRSRRLLIRFRTGTQRGMTTVGGDVHSDEVATADARTSDVTEETAATDAPAQNDGQDCVVCYERRRCCVFLECGHRVCCATCSLILLRSDPPRRVCPVCRKAIDRAIKVFDA